MVMVDVGDSSQQMESWSKSVIMLKASCHCSTFMKSKMVDGTLIGHI